jgi:hypothetical protein
VVKIATFAKPENVMPNYKMTRKTLIYLTILLSACGHEKTSENSVLKSNQVKADSLAIQSDKNVIEHVRVPYFVGDINNDNKVDSAYVIYDRSVRADSTIEKECVNKNCEVTLKFTGNIPDLIIDQSLGIYIQKTEDLNNDKANEIVLFSEWFEGYWYHVYVWTFKNGKWNEIARTKAFLSEDKDYENRIIKTKSQYYLVGDGWDDSKGGVTERSIKIKIEK